MALGLLFKWHGILRSSFAKAGRAAPLQQRRPQYLLEMYGSNTKLCGFPAQLRCNKQPLDYLGVAWRHSKRPALRGLPSEAGGANQKRNHWHSSSAACATRPGTARSPVWARRAPLKPLRVRRLIDTVDRPNCGWLQRCSKAVALRREPAFCLSSPKAFSNSSRRFSLAHTRRG